MEDQKLKFNMTKCSKKHVLACKHLFEGKRQKAYLVLEDEPLDDEDTGKIYTCKKCAENKPETEEEFQNMLSVYCETCLRNRCL